MRHFHDPGWDHTCWRCCWSSLEISLALDVLQRNALGWFPLLPLNPFPLISPLCVSFSLFPSQYLFAWSRLTIVLLPCIFLSSLVVLLSTFLFYVPFVLFIHFSCSLFSVILTLFLTGRASLFLLSCSINFQNHFSWLHTHTHSKPFTYYTESQRTQNSWVCFSWEDSVSHQPCDTTMTWKWRTFEHGDLHHCTPISLPCAEVVKAQKLWFWLTERGGTRAAQCLDTQQLSQGGKSSKKGNIYNQKHVLGLRTRGVKNRDMWA